MRPFLNKDTKVRIHVLFLVYYFKNLRVIFSILFLVSALMVLYGHVTYNYLTILYRDYSELSNKIIF